MNFPELFSDLNKEFSQEISLGVCIAVGIHLTTKVKNKDYDEEGRFAKRIEKKIETALWEYSDDDRLLIIKIWDKVHDFRTRKSLEGLGGCEVKTFKELLEDE